MHPRDAVYRLSRSRGILRRFSTNETEAAVYVAHTIITATLISIFALEVPKITQPPRSLWLQLEILILMKSRDT